MAGDKKVACPECGTENDAAAEKCTKCELPFVLGESVKLTDVLRIFKIGQKTAKEPEKKGRFRLFGSD